MAETDKCPECGVSAKDINDLTGEIDRLRSALSESDRVAIAAQNGGVTYMAEARRLRAALHDVASCRLVTDCGIHPMRAEGLRFAFEQTAEIARNALASSPDNQNGDA